jgi:hypothetical protein
MNKKTYISIGVAIVFILGIWAIYFVNNKNIAPKLNYDIFAKCLADKGAVMYGAEWCAHCKAEKANFGSSFQYVKYVECPDDVAVCTEKGINGFPTWIIGDKLYEGEQGLQKLSELSSCPLPTAESI